MTTAEVIAIANSFPEVHESPHFHKTSFRIKKKIFATLTNEPPELVVKLSLIDQSVFCDMIPAFVKAVPGGWGRKGWTLVAYKELDIKPLTDLLTTAYKNVAPTSLGNFLED